MDKAHWLYVFLFLVSGAALSAPTEEIIIENHVFSPAKTEHPCRAKGSAASGQQRRIARRI